MPNFTTETPIDIDISIPSGSVTVVAEERDTTEVRITARGDSDRSKEIAEAVEVNFENGKLVIEATKVHRLWPFGDKRIDVEVNAPTGSNARVSVASASVACRGTYGEVRVDTASGRVEVEDVAGDAKIHTASGRIAINSVGGDFDGKSASGRIHLATVGGSSVTKSASGRLEIGTAGGDVTARTASGKVEIGSVQRGIISISTVSGKVSIGVVPDVAVWLDLNSVSGKLTSDLDTSGAQPESHDLSIKAKTVSGKIEILKAPQPAAV